MNKPKILFINSVCGFGSTGRIVSDLSNIEDFETLVCYGRKNDLANVNSYKFANFFDNAFGAIQTIVFGNNINICSLATKRLIKKIKEFNPDIIHLHNLHGYYVNVEMLFNFLKEYNKPVVWTLHDCWGMTGYCPHFDFIGCDKYKTKCKDCHHGLSYPFSIFKQNVEKEFKKKKELFNSINNLTLVTPSKWLANIVENSYLKDKQIQVINNGIRLENYKPSKTKNDRFTILALANVWSKEKGIDELNKIIPLLDKDIDVVVVGNRSDKAINTKSIKYTNSKEELIDLYSSSHVLLNVTLEENFPTINIESIACGTPVVTYNTGGSPEIIDDKSGIIVNKRDYKAAAGKINNLKKNYVFSIDDCIKRAKQFDYNNMLNKYKELYESLLVK